jgi:hypothetical protein
MSVPLPAGARVMVEGKVGLLNRDGTKVTPDTRKGLLRVVRVSKGHFSYLIMLLSGAHDQVVPAD